MIPGVNEVKLIEGLMKIFGIMLVEMVSKGHLPMVILAGSKPVDGKYECSIWPVSPGSDPLDLARVMGEAAALILSGKCAEVDETEGGKE